MADPISAAATAFANWATGAFISTTGVTSLAASQVVYATAYAAAYAGITYGVTTGLNALAQAQVPRPGAGKSARRQTVPERLYVIGGGTRVGGSYVLREAVGAKLAVVTALCEGPLDSIGQIYLNDNPVTIDGGGWVQEGEGGRYGTGDLVQIKTRLGAATETHYGELTAEFEAVWPTTSRGDGVASLMMTAQHRSRETFSKFYPNGEPIPSAVCVPVCYDWRDPAQDRADPTTWGVTANPVVWLVHVEWTRHGRSWDRCIAPVLDALTAEADYCDGTIARIGGTEPRYRVNGFYSATTEPDAVRRELLASMDGWLSVNGKGHLVIKAGRYQEPTFVLTGDHIEGFDWSSFVPAEEAVNELTITFTSPAHDYAEVACDPWRDEGDISAVGRVRSDALALPWVHYHTQSRRLAKRKFRRQSSERRGKIITGPCGLNALGERYIRVQNPALASMADVVCEVMQIEVDLISGTVTLDVIKADPDIDAWDPETEEGATPPVGEAAPVVVYVEEPSEFSAVGAAGKITFSARAPGSTTTTLKFWRSTGAFNTAVQAGPTQSPGLSQVVTYEDTGLAANTYNCWAQSFNADGVASALVGPILVTVT